MKVWGQPLLKKFLTSFLIESIAFNKNVSDILRKRCHIRHTWSVTFILVYKLAKMLVWSVNNEVEGIWKEAVAPSIRTAPISPRFEPGRSLLHKPLNRLAVSVTQTETPTKTLRSSTVRKSTAEYMVGLLVTGLIKSTELITSLLVKLAVNSAKYEITSPSRKLPLL